MLLYNLFIKTSELLLIVIFILLNDVRDDYFYDRTLSGRPSVQPSLNRSFYQVACWRGGVQ